MTGTLAIVGALRAELAPLFAAARGVTAARGAGQRWRRATVAGQPVVLAATGDGCRAAKRGIEALLDAERPDRLLILGVSGGLSPDLASGDLVVAGEVVPPQEGVEPDAEFCARLQRRPGVRTGTIIGVEAIVLDPAAKAKAWRQYGAPPAAVADLESTVFAAAAARRSIPFA